MTREEEIKERLENNDYMDPGKFLDQAPEDLRYLLARNEELQRRVEKMERVVEAARLVSSGMYDDGADHMLHDALSALDAADAEEK